MLRCPLLALLSALELLNCWGSFLDTGGLYTSVSMDGAVDSLCAFRGSALYFSGMFFIYDDLSLPLWRVN